MLARVAPQRQALERERDEHRAKVKAQQPVIEVLDPEEQHQSHVLAEEDREDADLGLGALG